MFVSVAFCLSCFIMYLLFIVITGYLYESMLSVEHLRFVEQKVVTMFDALSILPSFDTVGWVTGRH